MPSKYTGEDALAYQEGPADPAGPVNYVQKRLQKRKGVEVVFDPKGHKYVHTALFANDLHTDAGARYCLLAETF